MGDFNCNLASPQPDINTVLLTNIVDIYNLYQLIDSPTRITITSSTLIDVILRNCQNNVVSAGVSHVSLSDHSLVYAFRKISINSPKGRYWVASMAIPVGKWVGFVRLIFFIFRVGKSLACHSPAKWCLCA